MYNDEYHYTYQGSEPGARYDANAPFRNYDGTTHVAEFRPVKKKKAGAKIAALALCAALLGGVAGGGASWAVATRVGGPVVKETTIQISGRDASESGGAESVALTAGGKAELTEKQVYAANVNSVVSINVTSQATNVFGQRVPTASSGSGFLLTTDGYIITNYHVIDGGQSVKVTLYDGTEYEAKVIGGDEDYDVAVLKIEGEFKAVTLGDSSKLAVGDHVTAIGNPLGDLTFSMSEGIASSVNRAINVDGTPFNMIQVTCAINPGNSGGPLFNAYGEVVGIVSAKYSSYASTSVEGLGFAIPINDVLSMVEDIMTNGYVTNKPFLGITPQSMTRSMAAQFNYTVNSGVFVCSVEEDSAASRAGLKMGDVITKVDDTEIKTVEDLNAAKKKYAAGDAAKLTLYRDGETITVDITWGSVPAELQNPQTEEDTTQNSQNSQWGNDNNGGYYGGYPFGGSFFDYFFGNGFGGFGG